MGIEDMYERRMKDSNEFSGWGKNDKPPKEKLIPTKFNVGDKIVIKGDDGKDYIKGVIISLVKNMAVEGVVLKYSDYLRYPKGMKDIFFLKRNGKRNLNGMDFTAHKLNV